MPKDHYVSQTFMKFWSRRNHQGDFDGFVSCFDFTTNTLEEEIHTKKLFAIKGLNSATVEKRLDQVFENQLRRFIDFANAEHTPEAFQGRGRKVLMEDENPVRAISIAFAIQAARAVDGTSGKVGVETAKLLSLSDKQLHVLGASFREHHDVSTLTLRRDEPLFLPETGCFWFPILDPAPLVGAIWALAIPLTPFLALVATPRGIDVDVERATAHLSQFSIADAKVKRVIIPRVSKSEDRSQLTQYLLGRRQQVMEQGLAIALVGMASAERRAAAGLPPLLNPRAWKYFLSR